MLSLYSMMAAPNPNDIDGDGNGIPIPQNEQDQAARVGVDDDRVDSNNMVRWRGNVVPEKEAKALCHVFDNLQDHFGYQRPDPKVRFNANLTHSEGQVWSGDLNFTYDINGDHCNLAYIGIDVCVDLAPKLVKKHGIPQLKDYGESWVYVYIPQMSVEMVKSYVKVGTGWDVSDEGFIEDPNRGLVAIEAKMNNKSSGQPEPSFWVLKNEEHFAGRNTSFSRIGSVQEVNAQPDKQGIYRGVGIFSVSIAAESSSPNRQPIPGEGNEAAVSFTLVSVRTWGKTEHIGPIVYAPAWRRSLE